MNDDAAGVTQSDRLAWARETLAHLDVLPREQVQALRLVYRDGLLHAEAAARLNVSLAEFARRVSAGLQSMGAPRQPAPAVRPTHG